MNYRELKKQSVKNWSKIGALILTILPLILKPRPNQAKTPDKMVWILLILLTLITYYTSYYTLSSLFWPQPLSLTNHLLLIPSNLCPAGTLLAGEQLLLTRTKTNN